MNFFSITHQDKNSKARTGIIHTEHGDIETPIFMPVGTQATVKSLDSTETKAINAQIILANTYHLHLRPGEDLIADFKGLHNFMNWSRPILTDSGGFQVFSLGQGKKGEQGKLVNIDDDGVTFTSHLDGSKHRFTPESAIETQHKLGADIIMAFDECTPDNAEEKYVYEAMERTHKWAKRSLDAHNKNTNYHGYRQFLFGIIQGANYKELRQESARIISSLEFDGIAIGGESIGYNMEATKQILDLVNPIIPENKPHYTMGVGFSPMDLFEVVERGVDMFDCVAPTRIARNGTLFNKKAGAKNKYRLNINNTQYKTDKNPIDADCICSTCQNYSRAYIHHLFDTKELLGYKLATIHNLHFFINLMTDIRKSITENKFLELKKQWS
ncbi:MAG: tRNA guanosine(34) transglycosylase Tgt [Candidatus Magasanikbacteria bacterium RIFCSPHIGHO2_01_FULL_33_34]|uniref:Queuine tRNA-ribosyltransferase n=1 Tax=Candidatus Magasanikbacteria bacterium RIFCSPHIGHO2_01_FULL_33_34 TaxID=1798671 RepID=A0A1F6LGV3_9BACT|nr:MAG: tRNA guanosine(34) transglycosylase Tgt [Candidatus Magasanikbacteria bacterium RIFCSPHIGHO2_01_FULL_33_34]OGH66040.1 MAG: tRNA guanosine(34) transglycosylase Tgt [Candidatus Magasanikbacteria bacterium RIFCSPHIGHO2_02_FULL_33_17]OGH75886.1 MAG: tRNA guanosine(34) transglycosylase Tgt [Candidatus Magasanikbacteria bacterium RIFCSPLOWO2_01_FULL_33_34]OGH81664.1 MAG: tRNA guanosine(34) transglycosylase Tgt [Candidatus Magasanikbacteria bacterium RIFCSPLOWO2_12_FULL_34_7]